MVTCNECGEPISKIPHWLSIVAVRFVCEECRSKHAKTLPTIDLDADVVLKSRGADDEEAEGAGVDPAAHDEIEIAPFEEGPDHEETE